MHFFERLARMHDPDLFERFGRGIDPELPRHAQVRQMLMAAIEAGHWKQGERLPNENMLTRMTPFSLGTVQRALRDLVQDGVVERRQGAGSFVTESARLLPYPLHCRFQDDSGKGVLPIFTRTLYRGRPRAAPDSTSLKEFDGRIFQIDRCIDVNGEFNVYSRFFASERDLAPLLKCSLRQLDGQNFKLKIAKEMHLPITSIQNNVRAQPVPKDIAASLDVKSGSVGLYVEATAMSGKRPVYLQDFFIPPTQRLLLLNHQETKAALLRRSS